MAETISSWHVGVAAEALVACQFARLGYNVSVQYGPNQPEFDLVVVRGTDMLKVSVKGSQDGAWGLAQKYLQEANYFRAIEQWLAGHTERTALCFVQFWDIPLDKLPRLYVATPKEVASRLRESRNGNGSAILYECHEWGKNALGSGTTDRIPDGWKFTAERVKQIIEVA